LIIEDSGSKTPDGGEKRIVYMHIAAAMNPMDIMIDDQ